MEVIAWVHSVATSVLVTRCCKAAVPALTSLSTLCVPLFSSVSLCPSEELNVESRWCVLCAPSLSSSVVLCHVRCPLCCCLSSACACSCLCLASVASSWSLSGVRWRCGRERAVRSLCTTHSRVLHRGSLCTAMDHAHRPHDRALHSPLCPPFAPAQHRSFPSALRHGRHVQLRQGDAVWKNTVRHTQRNTRESRHMRAEQRL